ncbi:hypothetical protein H4R34_004040 [Dimargaris verticillata]|uniref:LIM zinc-binding domain-containing protein n=1 Tax=Dimargaris verticillata TaxID=2761393 RepID=A0A9W8ECL0_9FUNG|nr:hypothetical protein H4R34_004040 [Dimargaris verticillata]
MEYGPNGPWHRSCLTCASCHTRLDSNRLVDKDGEAYCRLCHNRLFGPRGYKLAGGTTAPTDSPTASPINAASTRLVGVTGGLNRSPSVPTTPSRRTAQAETPGFATWGHNSENPTTSTSPGTPASPHETSHPTTTEAAAAVAETLRSTASPMVAPATPPRTKPLVAPPSDANVSPSTIFRSQRGWSISSSGSPAFVPRKLNLPIHNDQCARCRKTVYAAEMVNGTAGKKYHRLCFKCTECNRKLDAGNLTENDDLPYCKRCYSKLFGPKGYGYAGGAAFLTTEGSAR